NNTERLSAIANYKISLLNKRMNLLFSSIFNSDRIVGKSFSLNTNLDYRILSGTKLFASYNYNKYLNGVYRSANNYYQIGIIQDLPNFGEEKGNIKSGNIELFFYYDLNNNGQYDAGTDRPAPDLKTRINNTVFITPRNGIIKYRKVPYGSYKIKALEDKWYADEQLINVDKKDVFVIVPLQKTSTVKGKLQYQETTKTQYEVAEELAGIPVVFQNNNFKTFVFYTNERGEYSVNLPIGHYKVFIDSNGLQKNVYVEDSQVIDVAEGKTTVLDNFILKVKERKVEVKRFGIQ
ncbi:carboxypeptidase-like regulatory domain-containing protein, partial [Elizabethkingia meningoseptica]|nr:carboxypeptidase-like regulatory domain-containing protein [Elizabethkingia meningoseptica]